MDYPRSYGQEWMNAYTHPDHRPTMFQLCFRCFPNGFDGLCSLNKHELCAHCHCQSFTITSQSDSFHEIRVSPNPNLRKVVTCLRNIKLSIVLTCLIYELIHVASLVRIKQIQIGICFSLTDHIHPRHCFKMIPLTFPLNLFLEQFFTIWNNV